MKDLFGTEISDREALTNKPDKVKPGQPRGKAAPQGTGPKGETCRTCDHSIRWNHHGRKYWKCDLVKRTHGPGTDIRLKWAACRYWEARGIES